VEKETNESVLTVSSKSIGVRVFLAVTVIAILLFGWFAVRWQLGFMLADLTSPTEPNAKNIAEIAVDLSSGDPLANWLLASANNNNVTNEKVEESDSSFEKVVRLTPYNFSMWIELGRAYDQANQPEKAEKALLRAVELAPNYTYPHWQLGNFYLRQGNDVKAFSELQKAAENNAVYREQVFSIAWDYYEQNTQKLEELAGNSPAVRAGLAKFYAVKERPAESLRMWNSLNPAEKESNADVAKVIAQGLYEKRFYRQAVDFVRDLGIEPKAKAETVQNAGFEDAIGERDYTYFNWRVAKTEKIDIKLDPSQKQEGNRSLRVTFSGFSGGVFYNIYQIVAVEPSAKYVLSFWLKTDALKSGGMPTLEIINSNSDKIIASSESFPTGTNNWQQIKVEFIAPEDAEGITLRTSRAYCGENCPIFGTFWYDNFQLEKVNR
jgi:tetratricopeptide (TPR) repeat protein